MVQNFNFYIISNSLILIFLNIFILKWIKRKKWKNIHKEILDCKGELHTLA